MEFMKISEEEILENRILNLEFDLLQEDQNENDKFVVDNDAKADWCIAKLKSLDKEYNRYEEVIKAKIENLKMILDKEKKKTDGTKKVFEGFLREYFEKVDKKQLKTMAKYKLPSGELCLTNESSKLACDKEKLLDYAKTYGLDEYVKAKEEFDWNEFKKVLKVSESNEIINSQTGEILVVEGLKLELNPSEFKIKY